MIIIIIKIIYHIDNNLDINDRHEFLKKSADYNRYMKLPSMQINFIIIIIISSSSRSSSSSNSSSSSSNIIIYCYY